MLSQGTISSRPECLLSSRSEPHERHPGLRSFILNCALHRFVCAVSSGPSAGDSQRAGRDHGLVPFSCFMFGGWSCTAEGQRRQGMAEDARGDYRENKIKWIITPFPTHSSKLDRDFISFLASTYQIAIHPTV